MHRTCLSSALFVCLAFACSGPPQPEVPDAAVIVPVEQLAPDVVRTDCGLLQGRVTKETRSFKGIPYAAPPTGKLRWAPPAAPACWSDTRVAVSFGSQCPQRYFISTGDAEGSEDCLTLNVFAPAAAPSEPLPVLFFLHGGSNVIGSTAEGQGGVDFYDGRALASRGAVVVTANYRLGVLGFLSHPALAAESPQHASGSYGLLDQIAALQWVQRNIRAFGGDPTRVLLFGQSAGAIDTGLLISSPLAKGLFSRALLLSGVPAAWPRAEAERVGGLFAERLGCTSAATVAECMRGKSAAELVTTPLSSQAGGPDLGFGIPSIDGWVIPAAPLEMIRTGRHNAVPIVLSTTADEWTTMLGVYNTRPVASDAEYRAVVQGIFGDMYLDALLRAYPPSEYGGSHTDALVAMLSDGNMHCPTRTWARALAANQLPPVRRALFAHTWASGPLRPYRAGHGMDLWFGFGRPALVGQPVTPAELQLQSQMVEAWVRFAATGDIGGGDLPAWEEYDARSDNHLVWDTPVRAGLGVRTALCDLWEP